MSFLKGTTTWANLSSDLTKLICGEMADGQSSPVTAASGDRWIREYDTTVDAIRSPASKDIASGSCSMRAGYWAMTTPGTNGIGRLTSARQMGIRTSNTSLRMTYRLLVNTVNSVSGDYSTAQILVYAWNEDSTASLQYGGSGFTPTSAGDITVDGMVIRITNPTGLLESQTSFFRHFTPTFPGGIDYWPMYARRSATATFQTALSGTATTDWDFAEDCPPYSFYTNQTSYSLNCQNWTRSNWGTGIGYKTATSLTGAVYACSFPIALHKARIFNRTDVLGVVGITLGRMSLDGATYRPNAAQEVSTWLKPFQTPGQVVGSAVISYWISVKADGIIVVLSGDPGLSGKTTVGWLGTFTPYDTAYDVMPVTFNTGVVDYTSNNNVTTAGDEGILFNYWALRRRLDGTEGGRDWQTKWMRADLMELGASWTGQGYIADLAPTFYAWGTMTDYNDYNTGTAHPNIIPARQLKPHPYDAKWWMYGVAFGDVPSESTLTTPANPGTMDMRQIRGVVNTRWWFLPGDGWSNLDELTDTSTSAKYLLVAADYQGTGWRFKATTSSYIGGIAIAEI